MSGTKPSTSQIHPEAESWRQFETVVPSTPAEVAIASAHWERRGLLGRLVRSN
jgi:hypothetical protein